MKKERSWKFNIVDILVIAVIAAAALFFAGKFLRQPDAAGDEKPGQIRYEVQVSGLSRALYDEIAACVPCQMAASGKWIEGYLREVRAEPCEIAYLEATSPVNAAQKQILAADPEAEYVNAIFTCEAPVDLNDLFNMVGNQEIRLGRSYYVKSVDIELSGTIISLEKTEG